MYRHFVLSIMVVMVLLSVPACGPTGETVPKDVQLTQADAGKPVQLAKGGTLEVTLAGNPTTGYTWEVGSVDAKILKQEGEPDFKAESDATGAGGMMTLKFTGEEAGKTDLKLVYHQPWDKEAAPAETFETTVTVK
jgi:inhibitor of cysteine peptidase